MNLLFPDLDLLTAYFFNLILATFHQDLLPHGTTYYPMYKLYHNSVFSQIHSYTTQTNFVLFT